MPAWLRLAIALMASAFASAASAADLPRGFVYLSSIDPTIAQDMRYAGANNFTHAAVPGYRAAECVLSVETAKALARVQADLRGDGYGLMVYDCYRPAKAVKRFVDWASKAGPADPEHNPHVARNRLLAEGYIGRRSAHSSGGTVDLTLVRAGEKISLTMGTGFDFFDPLAYTADRHVPPEAEANRKRLVAAMARQGFRNYRREWWHFTYGREPFAGRMFDFDIEPKAR
jgi:D-alanyl-D-alanine dipeptidase